MGQGMNTDKIGDGNIGAATTQPASYAIPADIEQRPVLVLGRVRSALVSR
ncbi:hypothetical protein BZL30_1035 [Mycobacterium kansasii]|uniref:Uncharacterized protein n=1 Tax=Mycobacterium kansasii TaxID=1768 RepID=A0A1V3XRU7_MYCKA|nr:hypothetical protein BZL30_1035 [Mycobacterium kansasii]